MGADKLVFFCVKKQGRGAAVYSDGVRPFVVALVVVKRKK